MSFRSVTLGGWGPALGLTDRSCGAVNALRRRPLTAVVGRLMKTSTGPQLLCVGSPGSCSAADPWHLLPQRDWHEQPVLIGESGAWVGPPCSRQHDAQPVWARMLSHCAALRLCSIAFATCTHLDMLFEESVESLQNCMQLPKPTWVQAWCAPEALACLSALRSSQLHACVRGEGSVLHHKCSNLRADCSGSPAQSPDLPHQVSCWKPQLIPGSTCMLAGAML